MSYRVVGGLAAAAALVACLQLPFPGASAMSVTSPQGSLTAVSASAANNAWAVGCRPDTSIGGQCPGGGLDVAYHWNGSAWKQISVPMPVPPNPQDTETGQLTGVKVISSTNAWAVGTASPTEAQIVHWDGASWKQVQVPSLPSPSTLNGVAATSASDVWAVGNAGNGESLILHFNGKSWSRVPSPSPGVTTLYGAAAMSTSNAWAVGTDAGSCACAQALILHWNGSAWKVVVNALPGSQSVLNSVAPISGTDAWAGGFTRNTANFALTMRWNGTSWTRITTGLGIGTTAGVTFIFGVAATSASNVWAVGSNNSPMIHWNGKTWKTVTVPKLPGQGLGILYGVAATSTSNAWAVGYYNDTTGVSHIVILRWTGTAWTRVG